MRAISPHPLPDSPEAVAAYDRLAAWEYEYALQEIEARLRWEGATSGRASRLPFLVALVIEALLFGLAMVVMVR